MPYLRQLIDKAHEKGLPVIYTTGERREDGWDGGSWLWKSKRGAERPKVENSNLDGNTIMAEIAPAPQDIVILKQKPSGFFGTNLASYLQLLGADSVIVTGTTTSGCVRATVIDAFRLNFRVALAEEGCFDRSQASHAINLCDMHAKQISFDPAGSPSRTCPTSSKLWNWPCTCWITVCTSRKRRSNGLLSKIAVAPAAW